MSALLAASVTASVTDELTRSHGEHPTVLLSLESADAGADNATAAPMAPAARVVAIKLFCIMGPQLSYPTPPDDDRLTR
ncbi:hypothetical protein OLG66_17380 [Mycobacterium senegalense]|uniref:hypothetical protein n=1 Tax=Mycolicibacterium senegalense TaxID=1796 RepID=UPI002222F65B|nr:hypothetical protein [Mycolicibacterium senegalense]MCW1822705.1 hypothetical protein [Mycolicibacterium senegalense]